MGPVMKMVDPEARRAKSADEIKPLLALCKAGRLFDVQRWIAEGKPIEPPIDAKGRGPKAPLEVAIDSGFHSLVEILLEAGAEQARADWNSDLNAALRMRRLDIAKLLYEHGLSPADVSMREVFDTWDTEAMEYFIDKGADVETGRPLAHAFIHRIRTALKVFKKYESKFPSFKEQANIALRHHCADGNMKWVSLMLWAGADPYSPGPKDPDEVPDDEDKGITALEYSALYGKHEVFDLRQIRLDPANPVLVAAMRWASSDSSAEIILKLLDKGVPANDRPDGGSTALQACLDRLQNCYEFSIHEPMKRKSIDNKESRARMRAIHVLASRGAKWIPSPRQVNDARKGLLKLTPDYTAEFVWIMTKYRACSRPALDALLRTPSMRPIVQCHASRIAALLAGMR